MRGTYYISAIRIGKNKQGIEYISHAKVHFSVGGIIKRQGTVYPKSLILDMMNKSPFYTIVWNKAGKKWLLGSQVTIYNDNTGEQYLVTNSENEFDIYLLRNC